MRRTTTCGLALLLAGCLGAHLEYAEPTEETATEAPLPDGGPPLEPPGEPAPEAPARLDPAALDAVERAASALGLSPDRPGEQTLFFPITVYFDFNSATLRPESDPALNALLGLLRDDPRITTARIAAHSDARGSRAYNLRLTAARALAIAQWLVAQGVACDRLDAVGYGESRPIDGNVTAGGFARNRRVEVWIAGIDGSTRLDGDGQVLASPCDPTADANALLHPDGT